MLSLPIASHAQEIAIQIDQPLSFGTIFRESVMEVGYDSPRAAQLTLLGTRGRDVRIFVVVTDLEGKMDEVAIALTNEQCAYSLDNGVTWQLFTTGTLFQHTRFPEVTIGPNTSTILLRIGGTIHSRNNQKRGDYRGNVTVRAEYIGPATVRPGGSLLSIDRR
jgi:hypothetical protein